MLHSILSRGVNEQVGDDLRRGVRLINIAALLTITATLTISVVNLVQHNWLQLVSTVILLAFSITFYFSKKLHFYHTTAYLLLTVLAVYYFFNALLFHNSMQYAILMLMAFTIMAIDSKKGRYITLVFQGGLLITYIIFQNRPGVVKPVPVYRQAVIVTCILFAFSCLLEYFKSRQLNYRQNLTAINEQLKASNANKERMLSILSHDFNSPVKNLVASLQLIDEHILTQQQFSEVSVKIQAQLKVLAESLEDVLHWSKMQLNGRAETAELLNIPQVIGEIMPMFQYALDEKNICIKNSISPHIAVYACKDHLKLILRNLLSNAIKFSHFGGVIYLDASVANGKAVINVRDEGTGINPAVLQKLNEEKLTFTSSPGTANEKGTGLGLMLVREFLQKNNGALAIFSEVGKGSNFAITLPLHA